jgi:hypothetical protein
MEPLGSIRPFSSVVAERVQIVRKVQGIVVDQLGRHGALPLPVLPAAVTAALVERPEAARSTAQSPAPAAAADALLVFILPLLAAVADHGMSAWASDSSAACSLKSTFRFLTSSLDTLTAPPVPRKCRVGGATRRSI